MYFFVAKLLSITIITYGYVYHLRSLRPMLRQLLRTQRINFTMRRQHVRITRDSTVIRCVLSREWECRINFTLPETRVPDLHDSYYNTGLSVFTFMQLFSKPKKRFQDER